jgi:hypothetical protein
MLKNLPDSVEKAVYEALKSGGGMFRVQHIAMEDVYLPAPPKPYGCHNRAPIVTVCKPTCQYTYTALGQADARCHGCKERSNG